MVLVTSISYYGFLLCSLCSYFSFDLSSVRGYFFSTLGPLVVWFKYVLANALSKLLISVSIFGLAT